MLAGHPPFHSEAKYVTCSLAPFSSLPSLSFTYHLFSPLSLRYRKFLALGKFYPMTGK